MKIKFDKKIKDALFAAASEVREKAYAPYSEYHVGAALITSDGKIFKGCNVENASYGLTICAERNAIAAAIADGAKDFAGMLVLTKDENPGSPCGACRQVIGEFFNENAPVFLANPKGIKKALKVSELLPYPFKLKK